MENVHNSVTVVSESVFSINVLSSLSSVRDGDSGTPRWLTGNAFVLLLLKNEGVDRSSIIIF